MNILQALFFPPEQPGGVSSMVPNLAERFHKKGWEMECFSLPKRIRNKGKQDVRFTTFDWKQYEKNPIIEKYIQTYRDYIWWMQLKLHKTYDLIHAHHPIAALAMKQFYPDTPLVVTIHSSYENELILNGEIEPHGVEHRFLTSLYRELEFKVDLIITASDAFKNYLAPFIEDAQQIVVIPNGFDEKRFRPIAHDNKIPQIITVCRLVPAKGLDNLILACAALKKKNIAFMLHIIGDGPSRKQLENMVKNQDLYEETIFYGYMLHPEEFMPFFDIFVLPSRAEAFGSVFAEAALCWLALVGTKIGGIPEQIEHGVNGLLVNVDQPDELCEAIEKLIQDPDYRYQMARAAGEKAKKIYSMNRMVQQLKSVYESFR
jgi:glycosyltransferase involved in cell wall biosynthesis